MLKHSFLIFFGLYALCSAALAPSAHAAINEIQPLFFGEWIIRNNDGVHTITVNANGTSNHSAGVIQIQPPTRGIYEVSGLPEDGTILSIDVQVVTPLSSCCGPIFNLGAFDAVADDPTGDTTTLYLGATASTTGDGVPYPDQPHSAVLEVTFNF